jgi:beta-glucuronidase
MSRLFQTHKIRKTFEPNPIWDFTTIDQDNKLGESMKMVVPACIESNPNLASYRGKAKYWQTLNFGGNTRLVFKGVSHTANVYLDEQHVKYHYNAYTEFNVVLKNVNPGPHQLEVMVDNSFHPDSALHVPNDYYSYGGITRPVIIEQLNDVYIRNVHFTPFKDKETGTWSAMIQVTIVNLTEDYKQVTLNTMINNSVYEFEGISLNPLEERNVERLLVFADIKPYDIKSPNLYLLETILYENGVAIDDFIDRVGFREITIEGSHILLNGSPLHLKGFNRHEDYAEYGCSIPLTAMYRDIEILKDLGVNCVRTSHYPNDERFLDLCDENGILVWEEAHARQLSEEQMKHPNFVEQSKDCIYEMIEYHYNHPSIFVWGILNECASNTEYGRTCYEKQYDQMRLLDPSRPLTSASMHFGSDLTLDLPDIVSYNIYPGWYFDEPTEKHLNRLKDWIKTTKGTGKPLVISEIGAGAIYGFRNVNHAKWSEEKQADLLREQVSAVLNDPECSGIFIWQYADCRVDNESFYARPKSQNNKGVVDEYRRPKLSYEVVKKLFHEF